jgi:hypothetical protein
MDFRNFRKILGKAPNKTWFCLLLSSEGRGEEAIPGPQDSPAWASGSKLHGLSTKDF